MSQIYDALMSLFKKHRIVFWYDAKRELRGEFEGLILPGVELVELAGNEFAVKYRILREYPNQKFLIYHEGPKPPELENWLLDVELANGEFLADQAALWLTELGLGVEDHPIITAHIGFFNAPERRSALKALIRREDSPPEKRLKMLAVCAQAEPRLDEILEALLEELANGQADRMQLIADCELEDFLWECCERNHGYRSEVRTIQDFVLELFKSGYSMGLGQPARLNNDAMVFLKRWKDSHSHLESFESLSRQCEDNLDIEQDLHHRDMKALVDLDLFRIIDQKILSDLAAGVVNRTLPAGECAAIIRQRRRTHWFGDFDHLYEAVDLAAQFIAALDQATLSMGSLLEGVQRYTQTWFRLDQLYRRVIFHARKAGHLAVLEALVNQVENLYTNNYLLKLNNNWQEVVDTGVWIGGLPGTGPLTEGGTEIAPQRRFFQRRVEPYLFNRKKVIVIISDALRYEAAEELLGRIRREDRYEGELTAMLSTLPSYTQAGMAALLPHREMEIEKNETGAVRVDGISTMGTANRDRILKQGVAAVNENSQATAIRAEDLLGMSKDDSRALFRDHDVVYVYHNHIDAVGDKKESEERVFEAVEETLQELIEIIKKLTAANATNLIVTADHGFIYQNRALDESDFSTAAVNGQTILLQERRFVIGMGLCEHPGLRKYTAVELGLQGDLEIQIPRSIGRLRLKGSGSRYVHGGAALQEVVVPVLAITKRRESDVSKVDVEILSGGTTLITTGQHTVAFYQATPVSEKVKARTLRAGIYTLAGELISDQHELVCDLTAENSREREIILRFMLTREANQVNNQEVELRLEELIPNTARYTAYRSVRYTLRRSFTSDFDF